MASTPIKPKALWSADNVTTMVAKLLELSDSNTADNGFKGPAWQAVADEFTDDLKTKDSCSGKFQRLKREYKEVKFLRDLSGFGWDESAATVAAEEQVWDEILRTRPELHKWKRTPFPWLQDMLAIFGDRLAVGKHSFAGGQALGDNSSDDDAAQHEGIAGSATHELQTPNPPATPAAFAEPAINASEQEETPCAGAKRRQDSVQPHSRKRQKATGISTLQEMAQGLDNVADAIRENTVAMLKPVKEEADSTMQGQAQMTVQDEECLTPEGLLIMVEILADAQAARTYLILQKAAMRRAWILNQLQTYAAAQGGSVWDWYVNLDCVL